MSSFIINSPETPTSTPPSSAPEPTLSLEILTSLHDLEALRPAWQILYRDDPHATPFQSPAWLLPWARHILQGQLFSLALFTPNNHLAALLPACIYTHPQTRKRHLFPLGIATSDYAGPLFDHRFSLPAAQRLLKTLQEQAHHYDLVELPQLPPANPLLAAAPATLLTPSDPCHLLQLRSDFPPDPASPCLPTELPTLPRRIQQNLRYYHRRALRRGILHCSPATPETLPTRFNQLLEFHAARWHTHHQCSVLDDPRVQAMHHEALPQLLADNLLHFLTLSLNDSPLAVMYALADPPTRPARSFYYYLAGFNPTHHDLSPGTLLTAHALLHASHLPPRPCTTFNFLRGEESYKSLWGAAPEPTYKLTLPLNHLTT